MVLLIAGLVVLAAACAGLALALSCERVRRREGADELTARAAETEAALSALARQKRRVEILHRAGERLAAASGLEAVADAILGEIGRALGADVGALWAREASCPDVLGLVGVLGLGRDDFPGELRAGTGLAGRVLAEGRTLSPDASPEAVAVDGGAATALRAEVHLPLSAGDRVLGVVSLARLDATPFTPEELDTAARVSEQAAVALAGELALRQAVRSARINQAVLDATPDPIGLLDREGRLTASNESMARLWRAGHALDLPGEDPDRGGRDELGVDGLVYSRYAAAVHDADDARLGRLLALRDVTAERAAERLKDEFFALVSHELRTPLTSIVGYLELARDDEGLDPDTRRFLDVVDRNAGRLQRLVGDLLFVAQAEAGRIALEQVPVELRTVVAESVEAARPAAERAGVALTLEAPDGASLTGDRERLGQVVDNLISNACKFTPGGDVTVTLRIAGGQALLEVADNGLGIPAAEQDRLFERFFRASTAGSAKVPGVGLGLTIVRTIVEAHGGSVGLRSAEGAGTVVGVTLPVSTSLEATAHLAGAIA